MKHVTLAFTMTALAACGTNSGTSSSVMDAPANSTETYLMAENVTIESQQSTDGQTALTLAYDLPCWASPVELVDVLEIQGSPLNPAAGFAISAGVLVKGNLMLPCLGSTRKTISKTLNTNAVEGNFLGIKLIDARITSGNNPHYFAAKNVSIDSQEQSANGHTTLTLSYDLPCWATAVAPVPLFDVLEVKGSPINPAADFSIAVGVLVKGNPMNPCAHSDRKTTAKTLNTNAVEGSFLGFHVITK